MTSDQKELLIRDLCSRLPYGVKVKILSMESPLTVLSINTNGETWVKGDKGYPFEIDWENCKPYLIPLSSMTEEQKDEIRNRFCYEWETDEDVSDLWKHELEFGYALEFIQWCYENHLDIGGLIPKGLAVDATGKNVYQNMEYKIDGETIKLDDDILSEYNVILTFANKLLSENIHIDMEIQNIIDEHFWDML